MAALTFTTSALLGGVFGLGLPVASRADEPKPTPASDANAATISTSTDSSPPARVKLDLAIVGLGPKGCDVEITPGHGGCRFRTETRHIGPEDAGKKSIVLENVQIVSPDRYCMFAITIREPGQPVKTVRRGLRLMAQPPGRNTPQVLNCYLSSPSKLAKAAEMRERR
jgi:hypothetical protein